MRMALRFGFSSLAVGNAVGSSIFNSLCILGTTALFYPLQGAGFTWTDLGLILAAPVVLLPFAGTGLKLVRWEGGLLLFLYGAYILWRSTVG